ncbi:MAG: Na+/H+ antiporter subunit E [Gammaproteobacteria bacterium]|nr:Na+/H+ antiporter subunit E [Gammaproteobacteria bacterium]
MKIFSFGALLFVLWILLSGKFSLLLLSLGGGSVVLTLIIAKRMNVIDHESYPVHLYAKFPAFFIYIMVEIIKSNFVMIKRILKLGKIDISPQLVNIPVSQKTDLGRVIYANSITLTPGTVSIELDPDWVTVHALTKEGADDLLEGSMARKIPDQGVEK